MVRTKKVRMAKKMKLSQQDEEGIDREFWDSVGPAGRFNAAWEMVSEISVMRGGDGSQPRLQRSIQNIQRQRR